MFLYKNELNVWEKNILKGKSQNWECGYLAWKEMENKNVRDTIWKVDIAGVVLKGSDGAWGQN